MGEVGQVVKNELGKVTVILERVEACAKCRACTAGFSKDEMKIIATNLCGADINDYVNIELESKNFLIAIGVMYGFPLITLVIGFFVGEIFSKNLGFASNSEIIGFFTGFIFMGLTYLYIKSIEYKFNSKDFIPIATEIVKK